MGTVIGPRFAKYLAEEGLLPYGCRNVRVSFTTDEAVMVQYDVFMTEDRMDRFQRAFSKYLESRNHGRTSS